MSEITLKDVRLAATAGSICSTASGLTGGDRAKTHGDKVENHANIASLWGAFLGVDLSPLQVSLMMVLLKVARTKAGSHNLDDYVDMAGYAGVSGEIAERGGKDCIVPLGRT